MQLAIQSQVLLFADVVHNRETKISEILHGGLSCMSQGVWNLHASVTGGGT